MKTAYKRIPHYLLFLTALSGAIFGTITARYLLVEVDDHAKISPKGKLLFFKILFVVSKPIWHADDKQYKPEIWTLVPNMLDECSTTNDCSHLGRIVKCCKGFCIPIGMPPPMPGHGCTGNMLSIRIINFDLY